MGTHVRKQRRVVHSSKAEQCDHISLLLSSLSRCGFRKTTLMCLLPDGEANDFVSKTAPATGMPNHCELSLTSIFPVAKWPLLKLLLLNWRCTTMLEVVGNAVWVFGEEGTCRGR